MSRELRTQLCSKAKIWKNLKVPYQHRGASRRGCDCTGLVIGILRELGYLKEYVIRKYPQDWNLHAMADNYILEELSKFAVAVESPEIGDLVLFYFGKCVAHVGIVIENGLFIHCYRKSRCKTSKLHKSQWTNRVFGYYRLNEDKLNGK